MAGQTGRSVGIRACCSPRKLPARYAFFARGYAAYLRGDADSAIALLRGALGEDPSMAVAWVQLGETYTHLLPSTGAPDSLAEDAFDRAFALDSTATVLFHPIQIALRRGDVTAASRMLARFAAADPDSTLVQSSEIMLRCVRDGPAKVDWTGLARTQPFALIDASYSLATGGARFDCAGRGFQQILVQDTSANTAADGRRWSALMGFVATRLAQQNAARSTEAVRAIDAFNTRWKYGASLYLLAVARLRGRPTRARAGRRGFVAIRRDVCSRAVHPSSLRAGCLEAACGRRSSRGHHRARALRAGGHEHDTGHGPSARAVPDGPGVAGAR